MGDSRSHIDYTVTGRLTSDCKYLELDQAPALKRILFPLLDTILEINIKIFYRLRSLAQNRWIWGICIPTIRAWMKETTGEEPPSKEAIYAFLRQNVVGHGIEVEIIEGKETLVVQGKRFSKMTTVEFSDAAQQIIDYYEPKGCIIRFPKPKTNNLVTDHIKDN